MDVSERATPDYMVFSITLKIRRKRSFLWFNGMLIHLLNSTHTVQTQQRYEEPNDHHLSADNFDGKFNNNF